MGELRNQYNIEINEERLDILAGVKGEFRAPLTTHDDEILERKKAWADLDREQ